MIVPEGTKRLFACRILYIVLGPRVYAKLKLPWEHIVSKPLPRDQLLAVGAALPAPPEPPPLEPPPLEPTPPEPTPPEPTPPEPITPEPITPEPEPITPEPITPEPITPEPIPPEPEPITPEPITPEPITPEPIPPEPIPPEPIPPEPIPPVIEPTPPVIEPTPPVIEPTPPVIEPTPPITPEPPGPPPPSPPAPYVPPPIYVAPWEPGPPHRPSPSPVAAEITVSITGSTLDRWIRNTQGFWANARDDAGGTHIGATDEEKSSAMRASYFPPEISVSRVFLYFDLSVIPAGRTCVSVNISLGGLNTCGSQATIQEGTQGDPVTVNDFSKFTGAILSRITWILSGAGGSNLNVFTLNAAGRTYIESVFGSHAKLCVREYDHDYMNVSPGINTGYDLGMYFAECPDTALRPKITIKYK